MTEELVAVLSVKKAFEFKDLHQAVFANLVARKAAGNNEDLARLRIYEKLQQLVTQGAVNKTMVKEIKKYRGTASLASVLAAAL